MRHLVRFLVLACALIVALPVAAQQADEDKGFLTRKIQELLSGAGRSVDITGFEGALSSAASFQRMTISDDGGVWLVMEDVVLDWNRAALLRGQLEVNELSAAHIDIARLPESPQTGLPKAEATAFSLPTLPDLPVNIDIARLNIARLTLGAPVIGQEATLEMTASARLDGNGLEARFDAVRQAGPRGVFTLNASLTRADSLLDLALELREGKGGIAAVLLAVPDAPEVDLSLTALGPLEDLAVELRLATDGQERLAGTVTVASSGDAARPDRRIVADVAGDITAVVAPQYRAFFGTGVSIQADAQMRADGTVSVDDLALKAAAVDLAGRLRLAPNKWPAFIDLTGSLGRGDGSAVLLPGGGGQVSVTDMQLSLQYDEDKSDAYAASFDLAGLRTTSGTVARGLLQSTGTITSVEGALGAVQGRVTFEANDLALNDPAVAQAVGTRISGKADVAYASGKTVNIDGLVLTGSDYSLAGQARIDSISSGFDTVLDVMMRAQDLSRFSALAGRELDGGVALGISGSVVPLGGAFDLEMTGTAQDIRTGIVQADALLAGGSRLALRAIRNANGTFVRALDLANDAVAVTGDAELYSQGSRARLDVLLRDVARLAPEYRGALRLRADAVERTQGWHIDLDAAGPYGASAKVAGMLTPAFDLDFDLAMPDVSPVAKTIRGPLRASGALRQTAQGIAIQTTAAGPYSSQVSLRGTLTGDAPALTFSLGLPDIGPLVPNLNGPLDVAGSARQQAGGWQIDTTARGPSGTTARIAGQVGADGRLNLTAQGQAPLGLSAPFIAPRNLQGQAQFDLRLDGPAGLDALSGQITTTGATLTAPNLRVALEGIAADIRLAAGRAELDVTASPTGGGALALRGGVGLGAGLPADLAVTLSDVVLADPRLYRTRIGGALRLAGPLAGGAVLRGDLAIGETNVTVPSTGLTSIGDIPPITHIGAPQATTTTRARAGLLAPDAQDQTQSNATATGQSGIALDVNVSAPGRIFVRGRGLDAELGGNLRISGTTSAIISSGRFELVRGRLDILGKRFDLVEGSAQFQGDLIPYIRFVTTTTTQTGTASVIVQGPADTPEVTFESTPAGPQDEVLAQLLFGRNLAEISAFQALQLANAVATLAGRGGSGVVGNLRDRFGLDDLDVTTTDSGETALRVGKYLTDNVYTDVTAASDGTGEVSLNIDLTPNIKGKATLGSDGNSSLGVFFEKDY